jgi:hypothetical protein
VIIDTQLDVAHKELIIIFLKANELVGVVIKEVPVEIRGRFHMMLQLESTYEPTSEILTFMGFKHCGVLNMFDDYLLKCGVGPDELQPKSYHRQLQEEKEHAVTEEFMKQFTPKEKNEYSN